MKNWRLVGAQAERQVAAHLERKGWRVQMEPMIGMMRPDIVAQSPEGDTYVFEIKVGPTGGSATFSDLAQANAYAHGIGQVSDLANVRPVLATTLDVSDSMRDAADALGVGVVSAPGTAEGLAQAMLGYVEKPDEAARH